MHHSYVFNDSSGTVGLTDVLEPVTMIVGAPDLYVNKGSTINLTCLVKYAPEPPPMMVWSHNREVRALYGMKFYLSVRFSLEKHSGYFYTSHNIPLTKQINNKDIDVIILILIDLFKPEVRIKFHCHTLLQII